MSSMILMKTVSVAIKAFARPVVSYFSYYNRVHMEKSSNFLMKFLRNRLIGFGQKFNLYNQKFNRKMFRLNDDKPINPLPDNKALERGVELIAEVIIYSIILVFPCYEIIRSAKKSALKEEKKDDEYTQMRKKLDERVNDYYLFLNDINNFDRKLKEIKNEKHLV